MTIRSKQLLITTQVQLVFFLRQSHLLLRHGLLLQHLAIVWLLENQAIRVSIGSMGQRDGAFIQSRLLVWRVLCLHLKRMIRACPLALLLILLHAIAMRRRLRHVTDTSNYNLPLVERCVDMLLLFILQPRLIDRAWIWNCFLISVIRALSCSFDEGKRLITSLKLYLFLLKCCCFRLDFWLLLGVTACFLSDGHFTDHWSIDYLLIALNEQVGVFVFLHLILILFSFWTILNFRSFHIICGDKRGLWHILDQDSVLEELNFSLVWIPSGRPAR